jgi:hypothetical protein
MFARMLEFIPRMERKEEFVKTVKNEILPILRKQPGFLDILPLFPEMSNEKAFTISLWAERKNLDRYDRDVYPEVQKILKPYLLGPITVKPFMVETALCEHFIQALAA